MYSALPSALGASRHEHLSAADPPQGAAGSQLSEQRGHAEPGQTKEPRKPTDTVRDLLDVPESSLAAQMIHYVMIVLILASTVSVIVETMPEFGRNPAFFPFEMCITAIFTIEFSLRLYVCESVRAFATNAFNLIDFLAIFPGYVELGLLLAGEKKVDDSEAETIQDVHKAAGSMRTLRVIRMVRLVRVFRVMRIAKVARHSRLLGIILAVFGQVSLSGLVVLVMLMGFGMVLSASLIYLFESELCEDTGVHCTGPSAFVSIPAAFWWAIATLTTVGYGDMVPHTVAGRIIGALTAVAGLIIVAIGISIVSINFRECYIAEKSRADSRRRGGGSGGERPLSSSKIQDGLEIDELLRSFDRDSAALLTRLRAVAVRQDDGMQLLPMLDVLASHTGSFSSDVKIFVKHVLSAARPCRPSRT